MGWKDHSSPSIQFRAFGSLAMLAATSGGVDNLLGASVMRRQQDPDIQVIRLECDFVTCTQ